MSKTRTMKIDEDVAVRLARLKKKYKKASFSDLLDSFSEFFEITNFKPTDIESSKKPPSLVIKERTDTIIRFLQTNERKHIMPLKSMIEKVIVKLNEIEIEQDIFKDKSQQISSQKVQEIKEDVSTDLISENKEILNKEILSLRAKIEQLEYAETHRNKFIKELFSHIKYQKFYNNYTISSEQYNYYKDELI